MNAIKTSILFVLLLIAGTAFAADLGESAGHDLDALWRAAQKTYDLQVEDAVVLLESRTVTVGDEGTLATRVHRVVWIGTSRGIREYADLRVPWNSDTSTLEVELLRTWMDGRWWPDPQSISETAVVPTLPHALDHADDYTSMRETMLLHDGVELPCIMETAYTIAEQGSPAAGADGLFVFPQRDPAVLTEYVLRVPHGGHLAWEALNGAPKADDDDENGVRVLRWRMDKAAALKLPIASPPAAYEPALVWSTWEDMTSLDGAWDETVSAAAVADDDLLATLDKRLAGSLDPVGDTVAFVNENVRSIHYPYRHWQLAPRTASRTYATGYGHALDRAVLLTALLRHVVPDDGTKVMCLRSEAGYGEVARDLPRLSGFDELLVVVGFGGSGRWVIDADSGRILPGLKIGRWEGAEAQVRLKSSDKGQSLVLSLEPGEEGSWQGSGLFQVGEPFGSGPHGDADALEQKVNRAVGSVLPDAEVSAIVSAAGGHRFKVELAELPKNANDQTTIAVGRLDGGVLDHLPGDVHLYEEHRESPLRLPWHLSETVELRLKIDDREVQAPAPISMTGETGSFSVDVEREHGWLLITNRLDLHGGGEADAPFDGKPRRHLYPAGNWPELRGLLLESQEAVHGRIVFEDLPAPDDSEQ